MAGIPACGEWHACEGTSGPLKGSNYPSVARRRVHGRGTPDRMVKQILDLAFVEMRDLMPEVWLRDEDETGGSRNVLVLPRKQSALIDIAQWTQCFAGYVSVLAMRNPKYVPEMMAYLHGY